MPFASMRIKFLLSLLVLIMSAINMTAQTITGYVFDAQDGEPIIGAYVACGSNVCVTSNDGKFVVKGSPGDKIKVNYIGMKAKTVSAQNNMEVAMGKGSYKKMKHSASNASATNSRSQVSSSTNKSTSTNEHTYLKMNLKTAEDGFIWRVFCDLNYTSSKYLGVMDSNDKIIIPVERNYTYIGYRAVKGRKGYYVVENEKDKKGICNYEGREVIAPAYDYISFNEYENCFNYEKGSTSGNLAYTINSNGQIVSTSSYSRPSTNTSSYSSSSTSQSSSTTSQYGRLLYQGTYTSTGVGRNSTSISGCGQTSLDYISVYEKALLRSSNSEVLPYVNNITVYGETGRRYGNGQAFFLVTNQGMIRFVVQLNSDIQVLYLDQGDTRSNYNGKIFSTALTNGGNINNGVINNGGTYNNQQRQQRHCTVCYGRGVCSVCNGSKWVTNSFGYKGLQKCGVCGGTGLCKSCGGTGRK